MLPAELVDWIFTFLQKDPNALKSCSAAHPLLSFLAEPHLFVHIIFYVGFHSNHPCPTDGLPVSKLSRCLAERPHLANHTRSITIDGSASLNSNPSVFFEGLSTLLPLIPSPEKISLRHVRWFQFPEALRLAVLNCFRTPRMKEICLHNSPNFPFPVLDDFRNIKNLELGSSGSSLQYHPVQTTLASLSIVDDDLVRYIALAGSRLNGLTTLHAKAKFRPFPDLSPIFTSYSNSLKCITLDIGSFCTSKPHEMSTTD